LAKEMESGWFAARAGFSSDLEFASRILLDTIGFSCRYLRRVRGSERWKLERPVCGRWTRREVFGKEEELGNIVLREPCGPRSLRG